MTSSPSLPAHRRAVGEATTRSHRRSDRGPVQAMPWLHVDRVGDNVVARTDLGHDQRLLLVGHTDTVPGSTTTTRPASTVTSCGGWVPRHEGWRGRLPRPGRDGGRAAFDVSYVFYACEEVRRRQRAGGRLRRAARSARRRRPSSVSRPEAFWRPGARGTMRLDVTLAGQRAPTRRGRGWAATPSTGSGGCWPRGGVRGAPARVLDGCEYQEALQAVRVGRRRRQRRALQGDGGRSTDQFALDRNAVPVLDRGLLGPGARARVGDAVVLVRQCRGASRTCSIRCPPLCCAISRCEPISDGPTSPAWPALRACRR